MRFLLFFLFYFALLACSGDSSTSTRLEGENLPEDKPIASLPYIEGFPVKFSEVDPINTVFKDHEGDDPAWVELLNTADTVVNLNGLFLTDTPSEPAKWQLGDSPIFPKNRFAIFLSGKNLPNYEAPHDSVEMVGSGSWAWADEDNADIPGTSFVRPWAYENKYKIRGPDDYYRFSAEIQYGENEELGWHSACLFIGTGNASSSDVLDISNANELLFTGYITKGAVFRVRLAQPDLDDWTGWSETVIGTGDSTTTYQITLPKNKTFPDLKNIYGTRLAPDDNEMKLVQFDLHHYIARNRGHELHAAFKIKNTGGTLYLTNGEAILDSVSYPELPPEKTWGTDALGNWGYADPSPLLEATTQLYPTRGETVYLPPSGFYSEPFMLSVNANPTSIVRCEFGGKPPHAQSQVYQEIPISATTVVRCASFNEGSLPGEIVSRTYVFEQQPSIATVFLTGDPDSWFNPDTGIYMEGPNAQASDPHYGANYWLDKEIPVFVELFEPGNVAPAFAENAAYKIFGNYSRANDKKSASITFKEKYGKKRLEYPLFPEYPHLQEFRVFLLRNNGSNFSGDYIRDRLGSSVSKGLGVDFQKSRPSIVFYNGEYFGIHNIRERSTEYYFETNYGLDPENIDLLKADNSASNGSSVDYEQMISYLETNGATSSEHYEKIKQWMDVDNFINYLHTEIFANNRDWPSNNLKKWRSSSPVTKWKWFLYDLDFGWGNEYSEFKGNIFDFTLTDSGPAWPNGPASTFLQRTLMQNEEFKSAFINRFSVLLVTYFSPGILKEKIDVMMNEINAEIPRDQERWWHNESYMSRQLELIYKFAETRSVTVLQEMQEYFGLPTVAPVLLEAKGNGNIAVHNLTLPIPSVNVPFFAGFPVTLEAIPSAGAVFEGWSDGETAKVRTILPEQVPHLQAIFR